MNSPTYKWGDVREDGFIFVEYRKNGTPKFASPNAYFRHRVLCILGLAKKRALERCLEFNLDIDYVLSIYPKDNLCPALGIELSLSSTGRGPNFNSPSIDKIIPALGYIKGNVIWVSHLANTIKTNATPDQICAVGEFYKKLLTEE